MIKNRKSFIKSGENKMKAKFIAKMLHAFLRQFNDMIV